MVSNPTRINVGSNLNSRDNSGHRRDTNKVEVAEGFLDAFVDRALHVRTAEFRFGVLGARSIHGDKRQLDHCLGRLLELLQDIAGYFTKVGVAVSLWLENAFLPPILGC